jgi:hypothetical protein
MYAQVEKPKDNKSRAVDISVAQKNRNVRQGFGFVDKRLQAIAQRKIEEMAYNGLQKKYAKLQVSSNEHAVLQRENSLKVNNDSDVGSGTIPIQMFRLKGYTHYKSILAGDPGITPEKVREMTGILNKGGKLPEGITVAKARLMNREGPISKDWDEFDPDKDNKKESVKFHVVTDGHHRFISYVEAGQDPLAHIHIKKGGDAQFAYSWYELGGIEEEL